MLLKHRFKLLIILLSITTLAQSQSGDATYMKDDGYGLTKLTAKDYQTDILSTPVEYKFSTSIKSRLDALKEMLRESGITLTPGKIIPGTDQQTEHDLLANQNLPTVIRSIGPLKLIDALQLIVGRSWLIQYNEVAQSIKISIKKAKIDYANLRMNMKHRGIISDQHHTDIWQKREFVIQFRPGKDQVLNTSELSKAIEAIKNNIKRINKITVTGRSHSQSEGSKARLAVKRSNAIGLMLIENSVPQELITMNQSVLNFQEQTKSDAVIVVTAKMIPTQKYIPHTKIEQQAELTEVEVDNIKHCQTFIINEGSLKKSIEVALEDCGFSLGIWGLVNSRGLSSDYLINKAYSFTTSGLIGFLDVINKNYSKLYGRVNTLDRTVDFSSNNGE